jgi:CHAT domain-containing protein
MGYSAREGPGPDPDRSRLVAAVGERRLLAGRASGGFAFGPESKRPRGEAAARDIPFEVLRVSAEIRKRYDADPSPSATSDLALAYLLTGDSARGARLAELRALEDETPEALIDLSAAYLQRARDEGQADQYSRAYDAALRALRKSPGQPEALFDRAMAADGLGLAWIAREAWDEYLAADPTGPWSKVAREARARAAAREADNDRAALDRPRIFAAWAANDLATVREIASRRPDLAREILRREAMPAVARAKIENRPAGPSLALARELNGIAEESDHDTLDREALVSLEAGDRELADAHVEFARASQALDERRIDEGSPGVIHAASVFSRKGSPYAAQAELQSALVEFFHARRDGLIDRYSRLLARYQGRYPLLRARALWMRALCHGMVMSNRWQALLDQKEAFSLLADARQQDAARQIATQLQTSLALMGRDTEADALLGNILGAVSVVDVPLRTYVAIETLTEHLTDKGLATAALEVLRRSEGFLAKTPMLHVEAVVRTAELATSLDERIAALNSVEAATRSVGAIEDREIRSEEEVILALAARSAGARAIATQTGADPLVAAFRERKNEFYLLKALTLVGEELLAEGRPELGEPALREALGIHLSSRGKTEGQFERIRQFENAERTADDLVDLFDATGRPDEALDLIERLRHPEAPGLVPATVPREEALVSYWSLKDRVLVSVLTDHGTRHFSLPLGRLGLRNLVKRFQASVDLDSEAPLRAALSDLHTGLVAPILPMLRDVRRLVIVPDRDLWDVPFAGLASSRAEPLASRFEISFASSLSAISRAREWTTPRSVLSIGGPAWDRSSFPELPPLPESVNEAREVAAMYERSRVLTGADATPVEVRRLAPGFEIVHVATHAVANDRDPGQSFLLLSASAAGPGSWLASDPGWEALSHARLVVLSACRTGSQRGRFGGSSLGVLRSIQLSTMAQVVVSSGDVDDASARPLLEQFHRSLLDGRTPAAALREAQLDALRRKSGTTWMLFRVVR